MVPEQVYVWNLLVLFTSRVAMHGIQDGDLGEAGRHLLSSQWASEICSDERREVFAALPFRGRKASGFPAIPAEN